MNALFEPRPTSPIISFCFDDGYAASCEAIAKMFEARGLAASFCVVTDPAGSVDPFIKAGRIGDFGLWRDLAARGHEVMPHGNRHIHLGQVDDQAARDEVSMAVELFAEGMGIQTPESLIYHCAYNHLPQSMLAFMAERFIGVRAGQGNIGRNDLAWGAEALVFDAAFPMPPDIGASARHYVCDLIEGSPAWLALCFHGLEPEGWGPIASDNLADLLDLCLSKGIRIAPPLACIGSLSSPRPAGNGV